MNEKIKTIFQKVNSLKTNHGGLLTKKDEHDVNDLLNKTGGHYEVMEDEYARWDIEGADSDGVSTKVEVKSRNSNNYNTWIIDMYKVDYMLEHFPNDNNYFVNVCDGRYELYDMRWIATQEKRFNVYTKEHDGNIAYHDYYCFNKQNFILELKTLQIGEGTT